MNIGVVVVTYNRADKLKKALQAFDQQTKLPAYMIVVDNASTDATPELLERWKDEKKNYEKKVVRMSENMGGSGGFFEGLRQSIDCDADWIWVSDDDAYPEYDALEKAEEYLQSYDGPVNSVAAICGQVINHGEPDYEHRRSIYAKGITVREVFSRKEDYEKDYFLINTFSYVGTILNKGKLKQAGLPQKDYFIWFDDTEHGLRMGKTGRIICVPSIKIHHDVEKHQKGKTDWRLYYRYRNMTDCYKRNFPKRCYRWFYLKARIKAMLFWLWKMDQTERDMLLAGVQDAYYGKFGIHEVYRPGWKPKNQEKY